MEDFIKLFETVLVSLSAYLKTSIELIKLKAVDKISDLIAAVLPTTFIIGILITSFFFLNIGLSLWLGELVENMFVGFLLVGAFYTLLAIAFRLFIYRSVKRTIRHKLIKSLLS